MRKGSIVVLSYPDTIVRPAYAEFSSKIWPLLGIGGKDGVQAGHAALLLIEEKTGEVDYYDFGRYITSSGFGRVRSKETDVELNVPITAIVKDGAIINIKDLLLWLEANPSKTHGEGRLVASISGGVDYGKAKKYIDYLILQKEIPYGVFVKKGSNCARFVTDTIISATTRKKIRSKLKKSNLITPSPIGNVIKGSTEDKIYSVLKGKVELYKNRSVFKECQKNFLKKIDQKVCVEGTELPDLNVFNLKNGTWLGGIGSGAWFCVLKVNAQQEYVIARYDKFGNKDFESVFVRKNHIGFNVTKPYQFVHPTNCSEVYIEQNKVRYLFTLKC